MKLDKLQLNTENPRNITEAAMEKLKRSITEFPQMMEARPIVVDENFTVLGGNMRLQALRALGKTEVPDNWVKKLDELTEEQKEEFIIKDNLGYGDWDWDLLEMNWDFELLDDWGFKLSGEAEEIGMGEGFDLPEGEKPPFQQMTFTLADAQAEYLREAMSQARPLADQNENHGNENGNGNALDALAILAMEQLKTENDG